MTAPARIKQEDMTRACKAVAAAGFARARIRLDLNNQAIEIIIGESGEAPELPAAAEEWNDEDV